MNCINLCKTKENHPWGQRTHSKCCYRSTEDSPRMQMLCFDWLGAARPWSWPAGEPAGGNTCTCLGCSGPLCSPYRRWRSSRCSPPCRPLEGERSGIRSHPVCSYHAGILDKPAGATGNTDQHLPLSVHWLNIETQQLHTGLHTSSLSVRACFCAEVPFPIAARPVGLPGTRRGEVGSSSGIKPIAGPMWLRYGLNAILGLVAREGVTGNVVWE